MNVELRHLRALVAVIDAGTFTGAAERLSITQPALTRTIQQLEATLGTRLLERTSRSMEPTDDGRAFAERVRHVLGDLDAAVASVQANRTVRLGFSWLLPDPWAHDTIAACEQRSGARVLLQRCDDPVTALRDGVVAAAVMRGEVSGAALAVHHLFSEPRVAAVSARSPLAERDTVTWEELGTHPLVVNTLTGTTRAESWAAPDPNREIVTCTNFDEWLELVAADRGVGAVPVAARRRVHHHNVRFVDIEGAAPTAVSLVYIASRVTPLMRVLRDCALTEARRLRR
ncbi:LysR family transcriptional regulator [Prescottella equi]|uniref:LysR family transcriptional regulator n=1 Tax=Rhodococcus hoagii TaxID=43767 RepID=UPI000A111F5A|nr:LysR family transcriptional regulator [Prescottella equi]ORL88957.1 LysR family transcriptional regulator [Prescottella equi]ORM13488.1 LysR family transcriptional regulator [Prescottella equi]QDP11601.1 LysR family transcriptional regulator [Prescottella equi]